MWLGLLVLVVAALRPKRAAADAEAPIATTEEPQESVASPAPRRRSGGRGAARAVAFTVAGLVLFAGGVTTAFATLARDTIFNASSVVPSGNLITNPDAEAGEGSTVLPEGSVVPIPGWTTTSNFTVVQYGVGAFPSILASAEIGGGANFFAGGPANAASSASQTIDLAEAASEIDTGGVKAKLSAHMGGFLTQGDKGPVDAIFLNAAGAEVGRLTLAPVFPPERGSLTRLILREASGDVPKDTRSVRVVMSAGRQTGSSNDTYFDNLSLTLEAPPPPATTGTTETTQDNSPPEAVDDVLAVAKNGSGSVNVLENDSDSDGDALSVTETTDPAHGTKACDGGDCSYKPNEGFTGEDSFQYTISDGQGGSSSATVHVTVTDPEAPVSLSLSARGEPERVAPGDEITYFVSAVNQGKNDAHGVRVEVGLAGSDAVEFVRSESCVLAEAGVLCEIGTLAAGETASMTLVVRAKQPAELVTMFFLRSTEPDENQDDNGVPVATTVEGEAAPVSLGLSKVGEPESVAVGEGIAYRLTVVNYGATDATGVIVTDMMPENVEVRSATFPTDDTPASCDVEGGNVQCHIGTVPAEASLTIDVLVRVTGPEPNPIVNTAEVTSAEPDDDLSDNAATAETTIEAAPPDCPKLGAAVDDSGIVIGESWVECSAADANGVVGQMTPLLPPSSGTGALLTSGTVANAAGPNDSPSTTAANGTSARGALDVSILRLDLIVPPLANCVSFDFVFGSEEYPEYVNLGFNDGFLAQLDSSEWSVDGSTISAPNNFALGPDGKVISVDSTFFSSVVTDNGTEYDGTTPRLRAHAPVTPGPHSIYLSIFDAGDAAYDSGVFVDYLTAGTVAEGECKSGAAAPEPEVDLRLIKSDTPDPVTVGEDLRYGIEVVNEADAEATGVTVVDDLPGGVDFVNASEVCAYDEGAHRITCDLGTVAGKSSNTEASIVVRPMSPGTIENTASVSAEQEDPDPANNSDTESTTVAEVPNRPPDAVDDAFTTDEDTPRELDVLANDTDPDGDPLALGERSDPPNGTLECTDAACTYTPDANYSGPDGFTYSIGDGQGGSDVATVNITVTAVNDPPNAVDDTATTDEDEPVEVNVLANDSDLESEVLEVTGKTDGAHGTVSCPETHCTYAPDANFHGEDSFTYTIREGDGGSDTATVRVTVSPVNDPPVAEDDSLTTDEGSAGTVNVVANDTDVDGDALVVSGSTDGESGSVDCEGTSCTYTPNAGFSGTDSFEYTVSDGNGGSATATVNVTVTDVNSPPSADDDSLSTPEDTAGVVDVLDGDTDPDEDTLSITGSTNGAHGTVSCDADCTYTPAANYTGPDEFTYTISDGSGGSDTATVNVTVTPVNDAPNAVDDALTTNANTAGVLNVLTNDTDPEGNALTASGSGNGTHGTVVCTVAGACTYTPDTNYSGPDSFTYAVSDGNGGTDTGTVSVTVNPVVTPQPPPPPPPPAAATLAFDVSVSPDNPAIGDTVSYTIRIDNPSRVAAHGVTLVHEAPGNATFVSADASQGSCEGTTTLVCSLGSLDPAAAASRAGGNHASSVTVVHRVRFTSAGGATSTVTLGGSNSASSRRTTNISVLAAPPVTPQQEPGLPIDDGVPNANQTVVVEVISGVVLVRLPGTNQFVPLTALTELPNGTEVDASQGRIRLTTAGAGNTTQASEFFEGVFTVSQNAGSSFHSGAQAAAPGTAELVLTRGDFSRCAAQPAKAKAKKKKKRKPAAVEQGKPRQPVRRLWGDGSGKFRTRGRYSSATVRGTVWLTEDYCNGTLIRVQEGSVTVRDLVKKRTVVVTAGKSYFAEAPQRKAAKAKPKPKAKKKG